MRHSRLPLAMLCSRDRLWTTPLLLLTLATSGAHCQALDSTAVVSRDGAGSGFGQLLQRGREAFTLTLEGGRQLNLPTGPRSGLRGMGIGVRWSRCHSSSSERAVELSVADLAGKAPTCLLGLQAEQRQYFRRRAHHATYWELGLGLSRLSRHVPEQSTRTNFIEHLAVGSQWSYDTKRAWGVAASFKHVSNAGREHPNIGLNGLGLQFSYTVYR